MASVKIINLLTVIIIKFDCFKACIIELYFFFKKDQYFRLIITKEDTRHPPDYFWQGTNIVASIEGRRGRP